jgi:N-sulfoglucosamine sulfohydrolase
MRNVENFSGFANDKTYPGVTPMKYRPEDVSVPEFLPDLPEVRAELADQYEAVTRMDQSIGWVLENLEKSGRSTDTLVIYISDNGIPFPGAKTNLYDAGTHVPMIVQSPEIRAGGVVNQAMVSLVDLVPTILEWTSATPPKYRLPGKSLRGILNSSDDPARSEVYGSHTFHEITMFYPMRSIRTRRFKYILNLHPELEFPFATDLFVSKTWQGILKRKLEIMGKRSTKHYLYRPQEELYDLMKDPAESVNLAGNTNYERILNELRAKVGSMRAQTDDYWLINDNYVVNRETFPRE